jgi:myosin-5
MEQVMYDTEGFLEKNRDLLHADLLQLLSSCEAHLPQLFGSNIEQSLQKLINPLRRNGAEGLKQTVATKFKVQVYSFLLVSIVRDENQHSFSISLLIPSVIHGS